MVFRKTALLLPLLLLLAGSFASAQSTATLSGTVTDRISRSDSAGNYSVAALQPGNYSVTIEAPSFAAFKVASVTLLVDQNATVNARLTIVSSAEVINVQSTAPILEAESATVGQSIDEKTVQEM